MSIKNVIAEAVREPAVQPTSELQTLHKQARQANSGLRKFGTALAHLIDAEFELGPRKAYSRAFEKACQKYDGNCSRLTDLSRGRIITDSLDQLEELRHNLDPARTSSFLADWAEKGYLLRTYEDSIKNPSSSGFMAIDSKIMIPLTMGRCHISELLGIDRGMLKAYERTHPIWENQRRLVEAFRNSAEGMDGKTAARYSSMEDQRRQIHLDAGIERGLITPQQAEEIHKKARAYNQSKFDFAA